MTPYNYEVGVGYDVESGSPVSEVYLAEGFLGGEVVEEDLLEGAVSRVEDDVLFEGREEGEGRW